MAAGPRLRHSGIAARGSAPFAGMSFKQVQICDIVGSQRDF
ncbi:hypothetical protein AH4AK4_4217 [Aeromonas hydrophila 4AK4]|nr:hypothetical protein AH4AK4_4217 [Aeromonas hydrophila 4AK4]